MSQVADPHQEFESLRNRPDAEKLAGLLKLKESFRNAGHNPADPHDKMYADLGVSKDFFDLIVGGLQSRLG